MRRVAVQPNARASEQASSTSNQPSSTNRTGRAKNAPATVASPAQCGNSFQDDKVEEHDVFSDSLSITGTPTTATDVGKSQPSKLSAKKRLCEEGEEIKPKSAKTAKLSKGSIEDDEVEIPDLGINQEMQKLLESFGVDVSKSLLAKRKRLEQYTGNCLKSGTNKIDEVWQTQQAQRQKVQNDFQHQALALFTQWESDIEKTKENEQKLQNQLRQQQKLFQHARIVQSQRMSALKELCSSYSKNMEELEKTHVAQQTSTHTEIKREMAILQKKILMECQQQEMASVRKSLQSLFY